MLKLGLLGFRRPFCRSGQLTISALGNCAPVRPCTLHAFRALSVSCGTRAFDTPRQLAVSAPCLEFIFFRRRFSYSTYTSCRSSHRSRWCEVPYHQFIISLPPSLVHYLYLIHIIQIERHMDLARF